MPSPRRQRHLQTQGRHLLEPRVAKQEHGKDLELVGVGKVGVLDVRGPLRPHRTQPLAFTLCKRERTIVSLPGERDASTNLERTRYAGEHVAKPAPA